MKKNSTLAVSSNVSLIEDNLVLISPSSVPFVESKSPTVSVLAVLDDVPGLAVVEEVLSDVLVPFCLGGICCGGGSGEPATSSSDSRAAAFSFLR